MSFPDRLSCLKQRKSGNRLYLSSGSILLIIDAKVPLAEMFGYASEIRSATAGRGTFTMEPFSYEKVPPEVAKKIII